MKRFEYISVNSFEEASNMLASEKGNQVLAGGTDLLGSLKDKILPDTPEKIIDIKRIPDGDKIELNDGILSIGTLAKLTEVSESALVLKEAPIVAEAAKTVATSLIRNMGTIGGNICQDVRCWFYRYPHEVGGRLLCARKGGDKCYAIQGENRYHSIFGGMVANCRPCTSQCPAETDIPSYMAQFRKGDIDEAARIIMRVNPMPMITSRVCAHFCQDGCNRGCSDESVAVSSVERYIGDYILKNADKFYKTPEVESDKTAAIVGAGPSGLSAAYYLRKAGVRVTVYEKMPEAGGMLMYAIPHYRLPKTYVKLFTSALESMGIEFKFNTSIGETISAEQLERNFDSVYYATGAWKRPFVGLDGEDLTVFGLDFLVQVNKWMIDKIGTDILVTGGGNVAMDVAIAAKRLGAKTVTMACLESEKEMPASKEEVERAKEEGIIIMPSFGLSKVVTEDNKAIGMELKKCTSVKDEKGRFNPQYDENEKTVVYADSILMAIGQKVDLSFLGDKYELALQRGLIEVEDETQSTSRRGVFAGGDATSGPATVIKGVASGHKASIGMINYLQVQTCCGKSENEQSFLRFDNEGIKKVKAARVHERPLSERDIKSEDSTGLTDEEVIEEAKRCMNCGCYAVNPSDIAPTLVALDAAIITNKRRILAEDFFCKELRPTYVLKQGEIVTKIEIGNLKGAVMHYDKFRLRDSVDFAVVSLSSALSAENGKITGARIVLGGVAPVPIRARLVEGFILGRELTEENIKQAAELAVKDAIPMEHNAYKIIELKTLLERALLRMK